MSYSYARASRCSTPFVEPPNAYITAIAFSNAYRGSESESESERERERECESERERE